MLVFAGWPSAAGLLRPSLAASANNPVPIKAKVPGSGVAGSSESLDLGFPSNEDQVEAFSVSGSKLTVPVSLMCPPVVVMSLKVTSADSYALGPAPKPAQ
jgi:hypothetical protein